MCISIQFFSWSGPASQRRLIIYARSFVTALKGHFYPFEILSPFPKCQWQDWTLIIFFSLLDSIFYKLEAHIWNVHQYPSQHQTTHCANHGSAKKLMQGEEERRTDYRYHTIWCYSFYSLEPKCLSFLFQREKNGEGKISKALPHLRHPSHVLVLF